MKSYIVMPNSSQEKYSQPSLGSQEEIETDEDEDEDEEASNQVLSCFKNGKTSGGC